MTPTFRPDWTVRDVFVDRFYGTFAQLEVYFSPGVMTLLVAPDHGSVVLALVGLAVRLRSVRRAIDRALGAGGLRRRRRRLPPGHARRGLPLAGLRRRRSGGDGPLPAAADHDLRPRRRSRRLVAAAARRGGGRRRRARRVWHCCSSRRWASSWSASMRRWALFGALAGALVLLVAAVAIGRPYLTKQRAYPASIPQPPSVDLRRARAHEAEPVRVPARRGAGHPQRAGALPGRDVQQADGPAALRRSPARATARR